MSNCRLEPRGTETTQRGGSEAGMSPWWGGGAAGGRGTGRREGSGSWLGGCPSRRDDQCSSQADVVLGKQRQEGGGRTPCWWAEGGKGVKTGKASGPREVKGRKKRHRLRRAEMRHIVSS